MHDYVRHWTNRHDYARRLGEAKKLIHWYVAHMSHIIDALTMVWYARSSKCQADNMESRAQYYNMDTHPERAIQSHLSYRSHIMAEHFDNMENHIIINAFLIWGLLCGECVICVIWRSGVSYTLNWGTHVGRYFYCAGHTRATHWFQYYIRAFR